MWQTGLCVLQTWGLSLSLQVLLSCAHPQPLWDLLSSMTTAFCGHLTVAHIFWVSFSTTMLSAKNNTSCSFLWYSLGNVNFSYYLKKAFASFTATKFSKKFSSDSIIICNNQLLKPCIVMVKGKLLCEVLPAVNKFKIKFNILLLKKELLFGLCQTLCWRFTNMTSFNLDNNSRSKQIPASLYPEEGTETLRGW